MDITKVKYKDGKVEITAEEPIGNLAENVKTTLLKCSDEPSPSFTKAFDVLVKHLRGILELKLEQWNGAITIGGVSFSKSDEDVEGATITAFVHLGTANSPLVLNTPHLPYAQYSATGKSPLMPEDAQEALEKVKAEALAYLNGKRAQGDMFREEAA
jgi:hypothetical protein